jgi:hypothetical protein
LRVARISTEKNIRDANNEIANARRISAFFCGAQFGISMTSGLAGSSLALDLEFGDPDRTSTLLSLANPSAIAAIYTAVVLESGG